MSIAIITVHGTFAAREGDIGDSWWQRESSFQVRLEKALGRDVTVFPFRWSGENNEIKRRQAGDRLYRTFVDISQRDFEAVYIIGHSHGGNVIEFALDNFAYFEKLANREGISVRDLVNPAWNAENHLRLLKMARVLKLNGWITVGTPFLTLRKRRRFLQPRLLVDTVSRASAKIASVALALLVCILMSGLIGSVLEPFPVVRDLSRIFIPGFLLFALFFVVLLICVPLFKLFEPGILAQYHVGLSKEIVNDRWFGISYVADEAIWGLRQAVGQKVTIPGRAAASATADWLYLIGSVIACVCLYILYLHLGLAADFGPFSVAGVVLAAFVAIKLIRSSVEWLRERVLEKLFTRLLSSIFAKSVRQLAFNVEGATPVGVNNHPQYCERTCELISLDDGEVNNALMLRQREHIDKLYRGITDNQSVLVVATEAFRDPGLLHNQYFLDQQVVERVSRYILNNLDKPDDARVWEMVGRFDGRRNA